MNRAVSFWEMLQLIQPARHLVTYECLQDCHMFAPPPAWTLASIGLLPTFSKWLTDVWIDAGKVLIWAGSYRVLLLLTTLLIPHLLLPCHPFYSLTLVQYIAYMLFFYPLISSTESPQVLLAVSFSCLKENRAQRSIGHMSARFNRWREDEPWQ